MNQSNVKPALAISEHPCYTGTMGNRYTYEQIKHESESAMYRKMIVYDRKSRDFAMYLNGELVGYAATYLQAESTLNKLVYELLAKPSFQKAA
jgi:hypothetical protein